MDITGSTAASTLPVAADYQRNSIANVFTSSAAALGVPGFSNTLGLPASQRICVVLVDGLGKSLLKQRSGHAPFLRTTQSEAGAFGHQQTLNVAFPSTTATSLSSLGTGVSPGQHGMVGYDVLDPRQDKVVNLLGNWDAGVDPATWQPFPTVFERLQGILPVFTVSQPKFADSPMTRAALRGSTFLEAGTPHARTSQAATILNSHERALVYLYWSDLDKAGHRHGTNSPSWEYALEELDAAMKRLARQVPPDTLLLLTADHGMVDVDAAHRVDYSEQAELVAGVRHTAGEPRMVHLYFEPDAMPAHRESVMVAWQQTYGKQAWVITREEAVSAGLFGSVRAEVLPRIGDLLIAAREPLALYDSRRVSPQAMEVVGQHGSITKAEREVPLLRIPVTSGRK